MPHDVTMPQLGMAQDAGKIVAWLKAPGDPVTKGDGLLEVETDKATMEVEAQADGFLSHVVALEGDDVAVGAVIACITDTPEKEASAPSMPGSAVSDADETALPDGHSVTMPQLGMAQDTGLLVRWLKGPGDAVAADDVLFEVETDKSTMEVPAGADGYLAATLAEAGQEVPVGAALAIISPGKPAVPVARSAALPGAALIGETAAAAPKLAMNSSAKPVPFPAPATGRVLASPKARRLALEEGLDLAALAASGHPQPFHVADLEDARALAARKATTTAAEPLRLTAETSADGLTDFAVWARETHGLGDAFALLAGLAASSLDDHAENTVIVERPGQSLHYTVPAGRALSRVAPAEDAPPSLIVRDLRTTPIRHAELRTAEVPTLTLMRCATGLSITLDCVPDHLEPAAAITLLSEFAGRMEHPLRHLL